MDIEKSLSKLYSLHTFGIKLGLENITNFLDYIGDPHKELKAFHIAGSNGKGSTTAFITSMLTELNYKVGAYTSPHFIRFNERIKINNNEIPDEYIAGFFSENEEFIDKNKLTFFEVTTAMAFKYFMEQNMDYTVIETGLGGRLDATNVLQPLASVITSISLEHTNILGTTIEKIAFEKAGIIKNESKVFTGLLPEEAEVVIEEKCKETGSELFKLKDYIIEKENTLELYTEELELDDWSMPLKGNYQKYNAALASLVVSKFLDLDDFNSIESGIKNVVSNTGFQGRYEYYRTNPDIILDSAHNPAGIENFIKEFKKASGKYSKKIVLFGVMKDKAILEMLLNIKEHFDEICVTEINNERSCKIEELVKLSSGINMNVLVKKDPVKFLKDFEKRKKDECLVVLGSMYLIGDIKSGLLNNFT